MLTLIQKTHFQSQTARPEEYQCPKAWTMTWSKWVQICNYIVQFEQVVDGKITFTCQPIPRLRTEGGIGVALAYLETAMNAPVDYRHKSTSVKWNYYYITIQTLHIAIMWRKIWFFYEHGAKPPREQQMMQPSSQMLHPHQKLERPTERDMALLSCHFICEKVGN